MRTIEAIGADIEQMNDADLKLLAGETSKNGNASAVAKQAQRELCRRNGTICGHHRKNCWGLSDDLSYGEPRRFTKKFT